MRDDKNLGVIFKERTFYGVRDMLVSVTIDYANVINADCLDSLNDIL
jgi:hypothetical protein